MKIAVASGKGGTGKTTVSVSLALVSKEPIRLLDCDVEEPNVNIFIKPEKLFYRDIFAKIPVVDSSKCVQCGKCAKFCEFNAIAIVGTKTLVFQELCHSCGGCYKICPTGAIQESDKIVGRLAFGKNGLIDFVEGRINIAYALSPFIIKTVKKFANENTFEFPDKMDDFEKKLCDQGQENDLDSKREIFDQTNRPEIHTIIDCPPGTSCPVIASFKGCDFAILVTEPTPFGLHDLKLAVETVLALNIPFGIVINRFVSKNNLITEYADKNNFNILAEIPEMIEIAQAYSRGIAPVVISEIREIFESLLLKLQNLKIQKL